MSIESGGVESGGVESGGIESGRPRRPWRASWRSALRLAWRDSCRHRAGSVLILAMIGLPVMIISAGAALLATTHVTTEESLPAAVGSAQALIQTHGSAVTQSVDGQVITDSDQPAPTGGAPASGKPWTVAELSRLTGGQVGVSATADGVARWSSGSSPASVRILGREVLASSGLVTLREGRLPDGPDQVLVTEAGVAAGLPRSGRIDLNTGSREGTADIVGVAQASGPTFEPVTLVVGQEWLDPADATAFLVVRDQPVTWSDVQAWNEQGISVLSPAVLADPPPGVPAASVPGSAENWAVTVAVAVGLVLETALLAGPAFAVSAARRRRSLALIASNGADHDQIARFVMAQGVLLGGLAVLLGAGIGTALGWLTSRGAAAVFDSWRFSSIGRPPLDTYGWPVIMIMVVAFVAAAVSALVPGLKVAGLDVGEALTGRVERRRSGPGAPLVGAVIMGLGLVLLAVSVARGGSFASLTGVAAGGGLMIIGSLFLIPVIIEWVGRARREMPLAVRLGVRDASRSRARTGPAVAAITVAVAVLTMITISSLSDDAQTRRDYLPSTLPGAATVDASGSAQATLAEVRSQHPTWTVQPSGSSWVDAADGSSRAVGAVPPGCTPAQTIAPWDDAQPPGRCQVTSDANGWRITVAAANTVNPAAGLSSTQRAALDDGAVLVSNPDLISNGRVRLAYARRSADLNAPPTLLRTVEAPAVLISAAQLGALDYAPDTSYLADGAVVSAVGAQTIGMPWTTYRYEIVNPSGPISVADERVVNDTVAAPMTVERGYQSAASLIRLVLFGIAVALVLVASLISTALTQVEARGPSAVLAAMGAPRGLRRGAAAAQAIMIALLGVLLGTALGMAPGLGLAAGLTTDRTPAGLGPVFVIPYAQLGLVIIVIPLLAAALAALLVRRDPALVRRMT